jgi:predicted AlkP superfamily pyrophosphatase or phosphodiesterase
MMKKVIYPLFLIIVFLGFSSCKKNRIPKNKYVVVLSLDGFRYDYASRGNTPTLDSLAKIGVQAGFRPVFPSNTFPNHYAMATGLHPDHHGLVNNSFYAPDLDKIYTIGNREAVENPAFYGGEPIWNTAERQGVKSATYFWVGSEAAVGGHQASIWKKYDGSVPYNARVDSVISWLRLPKERRPHLIMWYIEEPDAIAHDETPDSEKVIAKVEELDQVLNYLFNRARKLDIFKKINFIVLSDHGMATYTPDKYVNLYKYLPRDSFDYVFDGVPTYLYPKPTYTETAYNILKEVPNISVYRKGEIPEKFVYGTHERISELIVLPDIGTYVHFRETDRAYTGGAHGYDNFAQEMEGIFYAAGPMFKKGYKGETMQNLNLHLIIATILGIEPAPNDGDPLVVKKILK